MTTIATASIADSKPAHITPHKRNTESVVDSDESHDDKKHKKPGRKPIMTEASSKRTAQNRAAQRAFRERKQNYLRSLEEKVKELAEQQERTVRENEALKQRVDKLHNENLTLRNGKFTYDEPPAQVDFDKAIADLFDTSSTQTPAALSLSSTFDLQQAALQGADLTKPGAMEAIQPNARKSNSPQSVPTMYPGNVDLSSVTANSLVSGLSQTTKAGSALVGSNPMIGGTSPSLTTGFSNDIMNGIQLLAANQNVSTGSFIQQFLNSSGNTTPTTVPISPDSFTRRASTLSSTAGASSTQSPASSNPLATPGDMYAPIGSLGGMQNGLLNAEALEALKTNMPFMKALEQSSPGPANQMLSSAASAASFSDLLALSPTSLADGLISVVPGAQAGDNSALLANPLLSTALPTSAPSQPLMQHNAYNPVAAANLPSNLMAYRNPDPIGAAEDGDQLEKLLLSNMYSFNAGNEQTPMSDLDILNALTSLPPAEPTTRKSSESSDETTVQPVNSSLEPVCTCSACDSAPCDPCPKHGSPADIPEELKKQAPEMLGMVCTESNKLADDELNDLCSLMFKYAKCSEVQKRVEMEREKLKYESEMELLETKKRLATQYGLP